LSARIPGAAAVEGGSLAGITTTGPAADIRLTTTAGGITVRRDLGAAGGAASIELRAANDLSVDSVTFAASNIRGQAGGAVSLVGGTYKADGGVVLFSSSGSFTQTLKTAFQSKVAAIDTTGRGIDTLGSVVSSDATADTIARIGQSGGGANISLESVSNADLVMLLNAGIGKVGGRVDVQQLGVFGTNGSADMNGTVRGVTGQGAGQLVVKVQQPDNNYRFNDCAMGSPTCVAIPAITPVAPRAINDLTIIPARPSFRDTDIQIVGNANEDLM
jgi:hypothetical protein